MQGSLRLNARPRIALRSVRTGLRHYRSAAPTRRPMRSGTYRSCAVVVARTPASEPVLFVRLKLRNDPKRRYGSGR
jgi:hypothetical protein